MTSHETLAAIRAIYEIEAAKRAIYEIEAAMRTFVAAHRPERPVERERPRCILDDPGCTCFGTFDYSARVWRHHSSCPARPQADDSISVDPIQPTAN